MWEARRAGSGLKPEDRLRPYSQYNSIGQADWLFKCADGEDVSVQSIFLTCHSRKAAQLPRLHPDSSNYSRGQFIVPISIKPERETVECLMDWAVKESHLSGLSDNNVKELVTISEELGLAGLFEECDLWLQNQARSGKLYGKVRQLKEQADRPEYTREYWDAYADQHKLRKLAACCEAYLDSSPEEYKRRRSGIIRRLSDMSWTSSQGDRRISVDN